MFTNWVYHEFIVRIEEKFGDIGLYQHNILHEIIVAQQTNESDWDNCVTTFNFVNFSCVAA